MQQKQGRVKPTRQLKSSVAINNITSVQLAKAPSPLKKITKTKIDHTTSVFTYDIYGIKNKKKQQQKKFAKKQTKKNVMKSYLIKKTEIVGTNMSAILVPNDVVRGSKTTGRINSLTSSLRKASGLTGGQIVRGHLLNHDLGGYGVPENLYPITGSANSFHRDNVESKVKASLYKANETTKKGKHSYVKYDVTVNPKNLTTQAWCHGITNFECSWRRFEKPHDLGNYTAKEGTKVTVSSDPKGNSNFFWPQQPYSNKLHKWNKMGEGAREGGPGKTWSNEIGAHGHISVY